MPPAMTRISASERNPAASFRNLSSPRAAVAFSALDALRHLRSTLQRWLAPLRPTQAATGGQVGIGRRYAAVEVMVDKQRPWIRIYVPGRTDF
jgi:hypothetical protein